VTGYQALPPRRRLNAVPGLIVSALAVAIIIAFALIGTSGSATGLTFLIVPIGVALLPVALIVAFRAPLIFPFGLWAALVPFDFLLGAAGNLTRYLALLAMGMLVLRIISTRRMLIAPNSWLPWLLLVGWMSVTALWTIGPEKTSASLSAIIPLFVMMTVVSIYPITVKEMRGVLVAIVVGSLGAAAFGFSLYAHGQLFNDGRLTLMTDSGLTVDPNFFATSFLLPIALCLSVALAHRSVFMRLLAGSAIFAMVASIFLSGSRGAFISVAFVFAYFVWKTRDRLALLAIGAGTGLTFVMFPTVLRRLGEDQTASSGSGRTFIWDVGAKALADHNHWLSGAGIGTFPLAYDKALSSVFQPVFQGWSRPAHNVLIGISVELGFIGTALLVFAWWRSFRQASVIPRTSGNYPLRLAAEASIFALFVNALMIDPLLIKYYWLAFMIPIMLYNLEKPREARRTRTLSPQFAAVRMRRSLMATPRR
jgi:O-antigen ligase